MVLLSDVSEGQSISRRTAVREGSMYDPLIVEIILVDIGVGPITLPFLPSVDCTKIRSLVGTYEYGSARLGVAVEWSSTKVLTQYSRQ